MPSRFKRDGMLFRFLLSDPNGDIELSPEDLDQPFLVSPLEQHPFLTLKDYFESLKQFITCKDGSLLQEALERQNCITPGEPATISEFIIRSEKHGAFYHIASIEPVGLGQQARFAVTTALSEPAKESLQEEFFIMQQLSAMDTNLLPQLFGMETVTCRTEAGAAEFVMVLGEWLAGYHEWHLSFDPASGRQQMQIWDYDQGYRFLPDAESYEVLRQAAFILTYYYDQGSFREVYPWHHGAGDFVVRVEPDDISVKLITVRQYEPLVHFEESEGADRLIAAIHFLLNLSLRVRLDRLDGVGEPAWIDDFAVRAAVQGFIDGLAAVQEEGRLHIGNAEEFMEIMRSFDGQEIYDMYGSLLAIYAEEDEDDFRLIQEMLPEHAEELFGVLQEFILK